jgi:hypothetical protein
MWRRANANHLEGIEDAIEAYHADVRERAKTIKWAADAVASGKAPAPPLRPESAAQAVDPMAILPPRGGPVRLR